MAFSKDDLYPVGPHGNAPRLWTYTTTDTAAVVQVAQYFNDAVDLLQVGDLIYAHVDTDGTPAFMLYPVVSNDGTDVDVSDGTAVNATDTD